MATTQNTFNGNGSNLGPFSFTFKWLESTDIKVSVGGALKTAGTHYNLQGLNYTTKTGGQVLFTAGNAPSTGTNNIRIYRDTDDAELSATFSSGSAIRAKDLNDNFTQNLYVTQEVNNNSVNIDGSNPMVGDLDMGGKKILNLATPASSTDASTKGYVDSVVATGAANAAAAAASASAAASSATAAANTLDSFDDRYLGAKATDPTVDNDGNALLVGAIYFNSTSKVMRVWNGANWQDSSANANVLRWRKTAVGGETTLSGNDNSNQSLTYTVNLEAVFLNGALLQRGVDYVATTGNSITGLVALTAGDVVEVLAFSQVSLLAIPSSTVTFTQSGTGAVQRTVETKLKDVVSVKDFGAVGDGVADDTAYIQAALNSGATSVTFPKGEYKFTAQLNVPAGTTIRSSGAVFKCAYTQTGTSAGIILGANCTADSLSVNLETGFTFRRLVSLGANVTIDRLTVSSTDQINNRTSTSDGAVKLGANNQIGVLYVSRFDNSVDGFGANNVAIDTILCESYVRGVHFEQSSRVSVGTIKTYTASANASVTPGHNGLLLEQVTDSCFGTVSVSDCGEHAVRIGSGTTAATENVSFDTIQAIRPGQCGFKINDDTYFTKGISVGSIYTVDCAATSSTGSNEDSVRIERAQDVMIGSILAVKKNKTTSANVGLYLNGVDRVFVGSLQIEAPNEYGVHIEDTRGASNSSIGIGTLNVYGNNKLPVYINSPTQTIKDIVIHDGYFRDCLNNAANIQIVNTGGTPEPCIFNVKVNVTGWTSPGTVTAANLVSNTAGSGRIYNQCTPHA